MMDVNISPSLIMKERENLLLQMLIGKGRGKYVSWQLFFIENMINAVPASY